MRASKSVLHDRKIAGSSADTDHVAIREQDATDPLRGPLVQRLRTRRQLARADPAPAGPGARVDSQHRAAPIRSELDTHLNDDAVGTHPAVIDQLAPGSVAVTPGARLSTRDERLAGAAREMAIDQR